MKVSIFCRKRGVYEDVEIINSTVCLQVRVYHNNARYMTQFHVVSRLHIVSGLIPSFYSKFKVY